MTEIQCLLTGCGQRFIAQKSKPHGEKRGHKAIETAHPIVLDPAALRDEHTMRQRQIVAQTRRGEEDESGKGRPKGQAAHHA